MNSLMLIGVGRRLVLAVLTASALWALFFWATAVLAGP